MIMKIFYNNIWNERQLYTLWLVFQIQDRATRKSMMENAYELLLTLVRNEIPADQEEASLHELSRVIMDLIRDKPWFPSREIEWGEQRSTEAARHVISKLKVLRTQRLDRDELHKSVASIAANLASAIFFIPATVSVIYSPPAAGFEPFIQEGANQHCRLIQRAVAGVVRKNSSGLRGLSLNTQDLEDELWGLVMEEIVRCLTDPFARIWRMDQATPELYPIPGSRGVKRGIITRVALSKTGGRLAACRTDHQLFLWDTRSRELIHVWDLQGLLESLAVDTALYQPGTLYISDDESRIALETEGNRIIVLSVDEPQDSVRFYDKTGKASFLREFGIPYLPPRELRPSPAFRFANREGKQVSWTEYLPEIYDWSIDSQQNAIATASELKRAMPDWMREAGFERSVFHIAKKRLIDLIRKHTNTLYACWRCGSLSHSPSERQCRTCGLDFSRCPGGCRIPPSEPLHAGNRWQCPHCGLASRILEPLHDVEIDDQLFGGQSSTSEWQDQHDLERILRVLRKVSVTYKNRQIPCGRLMRLKSEGMTNEEIGRELNIPRGSVDYVWNQCRQEILLVMGESESR